MRRFGLPAIIALALAVPTLVYALSEVRLQRVYAAPAAPVETSGADPERGRRWATGVALCSFCHGPDLAGAVTVDNPWIGRLYAPNLTSGPGGLGTRYSNGDFERALRHGLRRDGRSLLVMPSDTLSDADLADVIAYLRSAPPRASAHPSRRVGILTRLVLAAGLAPELLPAERIEHTASDRPAPEPRPDAAYGAYLASVGSCRVCHRADLRGGLHPLSLPEEPPPPDITPSGALGAWSKADFARAMRTGVTPDGRALDPRYMPWPHFAQLSDDELRALWTYLQSLGRTT